MPEALATFDTSKNALAQIRSPIDAKKYIVALASFEDVMRVAGATLEELNGLVEKRLRLMRRGGELLAGMAERGERAGLGKPLKRSHDATLSDLHVTKSDSSRWQRMAAVPEDIFDGWLDEWRAKTNDRFSVALVLGLIKKREQPTATDEIEADGCTVDDLFKLVEADYKFGTIYADPPWAYGNQATRAATDNHYKTVSPDWLCDPKNMPIEQLANDQAHLHLWTTNAFLFEAKVIMEAWGFEYKSCFVWVKPQMGIGNYWRVSHEFMLLGVRGGLTFADRSLMSWGKFDRTKHSRKPFAVRAKIESASPGPRLELFGREAVPGWMVWGNEVSRDLLTEELASL